MTAFKFLYFSNFHSQTSSEGGSSAPSSPVSDAGSFIIQPKDDLVKKELRDAIRHKRLAKGLGELPEVEAKRPKTDEVLNLSSKCSL
jgi:hypothetical protein